eukprot:COSAG02_NODE_2000_length_10140_cov_14.090429_10_plen_81_part_01
MRRPPAWRRERDGKNPVVPWQTYTDATSARVARAPHTYLKSPIRPRPAMHARFCTRARMLKKATGLGVMLVGKGGAAGERG